MADENNSKGGTKSFNLIAIAILGVMLIWFGSIILSNPMMKWVFVAILFMLMAKWIGLVK